MLCFNPHTHAGCDNIFLTVCNTPLSFNPHTHAGCDFLDKVIISYFKVSIHTPTQGVTVAKVFGGYMCFVSIHTPTQGVTLYLITYYKSANLIHCYANHHYYSTS